MQKGTATFYVDPKNLQIPGSGKAAQQYSATTPLIGDPQPGTASGALSRGAVVATPDTPAWNKWVVGVMPFRWQSYLRALFLVFLGSMLLAVSVTNVQSMSTSPSAAQNFVGVGLTYAVVLGTFYLWRQADTMPIHLHPSIAFSEWIHGHLPAIVTIPYIGMNVLGSLLAAPILAAIGGSAIPDYSAALRPVSFWGAAGINMCTGLLLVYAYLQNASILDHMQGTSNSVAHHSRALTVALAAFIGVSIGYANGLYTLCNLTVYFGGAFNIGFYVPDSGTWTIDCLMWLIVGFAGWVVHLFTWNVAGLTQEEFDMAVVSSKKDY